MTQAHEYVLPLHAAFTEAANPGDAAFMKKYMLNQFEYFGIRSAQQKEIRRRFFKEYGLPNKAIVPELIHRLWQQPEREFQYFGIDLTEKVYKKPDEDFIGGIEFMILNKSWWDTVDWVASHHAGTYFRKFPEQIVPRTGSWMDTGNMWLQRTALLFQLKYKQNTDEKLMFEYIQRLKGSKEFFIRKAIGWALREYSKVSPESVKAFVESAALSGLSRREALKWIERKNK